MKFTSRHLSEGEIRSFFDHGLPSAEQARIETHLAGCPRCRSTAQILHERAKWLQTQFSQLDINPETGHSRSLPAARTRLADRMERNKEKQMKRPTIFAALPRSAWIALALVAVLAISMTFEPVRALADSFLALFRVEQIRVVQVDPEEMAGKLENSSNLEYILSNQVQIDEQGDSQEAANPAEAAALAGFTPRLPAEIEGDADFVVQPAAKLSLTVDLELVRAVLKDIGREDIRLPEELDGAVVQMQIPAGISTSYGECKYEPNPDQIDPDEKEPVSFEPGKCTTLFQIPSPVVSAPQDLDLTQIGEAYLQLFGMDPAEAAAFASSVNWTTTFVVPLPRYGADYEEVNVDGVNGTLIIEHKGYDPDYTLIWVKDGVVYALNGSGDRSQALTIAGSIQ